MEEHRGTAGDEVLRAYGEIRVLSSADSGQNKQEAGQAGETHRGLRGVESFSIVIMNGNRGNWESRWTLETFGAKALPGKRGSSAALKAPRHPQSSSSAGC